MNDPKPTATPHGDRLRAAFTRAREAASNPNPTDIEVLSIELGLGRLPENTIADFIGGKTMVPPWSTFEIMIKCLGAEQDEDWKELHKLAEQEKRENANEKRRAARPGPKPEDASASKPDVSPAPQADEPKAEPSSGDSVPPADTSDVDESLGLPPSDAALNITVPQPEPQQNPRAGAPPAPPVEPRQDSRRRRLLAGAAIGIVVLTGVFLAVKASRLGAPETTSGLRITSPATTTTPNAVRPIELKKGPETDAGMLTWVEASVDGSMVGQAKPMAETIGLWSQPSMGCDFPQLSPCIPGSVQTGKVALPITVKVICVKIGQKIRNGTPGVSGYYEDDRWLLTAPSTNFEGNGYLSNVWYARDKLPPNLATCQS